MFNRPISIEQRHRSIAVFLSLTIVLATGLTLFYFVHEQLPRFVRAPSALLLAPVALVDGLCYATGIPGIYGKTFPIFIVNYLFAATLCGFAHLGRSLWGRDNI